MIYQVIRISLLRRKDIVKVLWRNSFKQLPETNVLGFVIIIYSYDQLCFGGKLSNT